MDYKRLFFSSFFLVLFFSSKQSFSHAVYVSVCNIYEKNNTSFFTMRMFKDDIFESLDLEGYSEDLCDKDKGNIMTIISIQ